MKRIRILLLMLMLALSALLIQAKGPLLPLAVVSDKGLYILNGVPASADDLAQVLVPVSTENSYAYYATWSPDGTKLAYLTLSSDGSNQGKLLVWDGTQSIELASGAFSAGVPISWTRDGRITYMLDTGQSEGMNMLTQVYTIAPQAGAIADKVIDGLGVSGGCGGGSPIPMDWLTWEDGGFGGGAGILALTDFGLVYSAQCAGNMTSLYRPFSADNIAFSEGMMNRSVLSPDETKVAGIVTVPGQRAGNIVVVDLTTMEEKPVPTTELATILAWGSDGSLFYASVNPSRNLFDTLNDTQIQAIGNVMGLVDMRPDDIWANTVRIYHVAVDGTETLLHEQDAYSVGRMMLKQSTLIYSTISNGDAWVQAMADGTITPENMMDAENYVSTSVNYLSLGDDGSALEAGTIPGDLRQVAASRQP